MSDPRPSLAAFDDRTFTLVADQTDFDADRLRSLVGRHQDDVRDLPGVDNIVYEWRNHFHLDPLVHRTDAVYVLALPSHVWTEFADDLSPAQLDALKSVHDRQARTLAPSSERFESDDALVLTRP